MIDATIEYRAEDSPRASRAAMTGGLLFVAVVAAGVEALATNRRHIQGFDGFERLSRLLDSPLLVLLNHREGLLRSFRSKMVFHYTPDTMTRRLSRQWADPIVFAELADEDIHFTLPDVAVSLGTPAKYVPSREMIDQFKAEFSDQQLGEEVDYKADFDTKQFFIGIEAVVAVALVFVHGTDSFLKTQSLRWPAVLGRLDHEGDADPTRR
jgi:hypothetical protein